MSSQEQLLLLLLHAVLGPSFWTCLVAFIPNRRQPAGACVGGIFFPFLFCCIALASCMEYVHHPSSFPPSRHFLAAWRG